MSWGIGTLKIVGGGGGRAPREAGEGLFYFIRSNQAPCMFSEGRVAQINIWVT